MEERMQLEGLAKRKKNRLIDYDYSTPNVYFVTVCTAGRKNIFWNPVGASIARPQDVCLTDFGMIVEKSICEIGQRYPSVSVDHFVIMPNHVHLLLQIHEGDGGGSTVTPTVSVIVQQMKGVVSKRVGSPIWQKSFHDHIVRNGKEYWEIYEYIENNPMKWTEDRLCMEMDAIR